MNENNPDSLKMSLNAVEMIYFYACHSLAVPLTDNCYLMAACPPVLKAPLFSQWCQFMSYYEVRTENFFYFIKTGHQSCSYNCILKMTILHCNRCYCLDARMFGLKLPFIDMQKHIFFSSTVFEENVEVLS